MESKKRIRILLIEDNPGDARLVAEMLSETRWIQIDLHTANCLKQGLEYLSARCFDLCLLDLGLPDCRGLNSVEALNENFPDLPVVILTGLDDQEAGMAAVGAGAQDYVVKGSLEPSDLERVIRYSIQRKASEIELKKAVDKTENHKKEILALYNGARSILTTKSFSAAAKNLFSSCKNLVGAQSGYVALLSSDGAENEVLFLDSGGLPCTVDPDLPMPVRGLRERAYRTREIVFENKFSTSKWMAYMPDGHVMLENVLFAPLIVNGATVGLIGLANKPGGFDNHDVRRISGFSNLAALSLKNARDSDALHSSLKFMETLINTIPSPVFYKDATGKYLGCNDRFADVVLGLPKNEIIGKTVFDFSDHISADLSTAYHQQDMALLENGGIQSYEAKVKCADGKFRNYIFNKAVYHEAGGSVSGIVGIMLDISIRKEYENRMKLTNQILKRLNQNSDIKHTIRKILVLIKDAFGIDAVGIRIKEGDDYPYYESNGFSPDFIACEKYLCARDKDGHPVRDENNNPVLDCMCGNVLCGRTDASLPFFTTCGSFWTNSTTALLAAATETDLQFRTRNRCHGEGYESVALVPIRTGGETIGLIQLNHKQENLFTLDMIQFFESIGSSIGIALDRIKSQTEIQKGEVRFRELIKNNADAMVVIDRQGIVRYVNFAAVIFFNRPKAEILGNQFGIPIAADGTTEIEVNGVDGKINFGEMRAAEIDWHDENVFLATIRDISDRKKNEKEKAELEAHLQQAQKMESIGTLAGGIAHDFNNILSAIIGFSELAIESPPGDAGVKDDLKEILQAGHRAKQLVAQILTFSRQGEHEKAPLSVYSIVNESMKLLRASLPATIRMNQHLDTRGEILADPTQIHQLIMNLCTNAYHAMRPDSGVLEVSLSEETITPEKVAPVPDMETGIYILLTVSDTGSGMDKATLDRIFEPYYTTKGKGEGTGLGLAVVHGVVKSHNGFIKVESRPGKGSRFNVFFPKLDYMDEKSARPQKIELPGGSERVLFVDDEKNIIKMNQQGLERLGYRVEGVASGTEALALFKDQPLKYDLVITDMTMPNMTGYELARELFDIRPDIPVILCTGFSETITEKEALALGIRAFLMKPVLKQDLAETIRRVLDKK